VIDDQCQVALASTPTDLIDADALQVVQSVVTPRGAPGSAPRPAKADTRRRRSMLPLFARQGTEIAPGAVHQPDWLDLEQQISLIEACRQWATGPAPMRHTRLANGAVMSVQTVCLGWHWLPYRYTPTAEDVDGAPVKPLPTWLADLARRALLDAYGDADLAAGYAPDVALVNFYDAAAKLGLHQDKDDRAASLIYGLADMVLSMLVGQHVPNQPIDEFIAILDSCLAEAEVLADLDADT
jgi:alkylated DNA repair dioxygenase AlkB